MFKLSLSLLIISLLISLTIGQSITLGDYVSIRGDSTSKQSCALETGMKVDYYSTSYSIQPTLGYGLQVSNLTIANDSTLSGTAPIWYSTGTFAGFAKVKGVVYSSHSFQIVVLPAKFTDGATYYFASTAYCPPSDNEKTIHINNHNQELSKF